VASVRTIDVTESRVINALATHLARTEKLSNVHILKDGYHVGELNIRTEKFNIKKRHKSFFKNICCRGFLT
jgi:RNA binding exosome subunit